MIKAELIYNPYLLETEVRFNGNPPRINSLVEKYQKEKLQTWVSENYCDLKGNVVIEEEK